MAENEFNKDIFYCENDNGLLTLRVYRGMMPLQKEAVKKYFLFTVKGVLKCPDYDENGNPIKAIKFRPWKGDIYGTYSGIRKLILPKECEVISFECCKFLEYLEEIVFNDKIKILESNCFIGCTKLPSKFIVPNSIEEIGYDIFGQAFLGLKKMTIKEVYFGKNVKRVNTTSFNPNVKKYFDGTLDEFLNVYFTDMHTIADFCKELYVKQNGEYVSFVDIINKKDSSEEYLGKKISRAFQEASQKNKKEITEKMTIDDAIVDSNKYSNNDIIKELHFTSNVREIKESAFENCINLEKITFENGVKKIEKNAFANVNIDEVILPDSIDNADDAFLSKRMIKKLRIPAGYMRKETQPIIDLDPNCEVELHYKSGISFFSNPFFNTLYVKKIVIPEGIKELEKEFIKDNPVVEEIDIPNTVYRIESGAFYNCVNLEKVTFSKGKKESLTMSNNYCIKCPKMKKKLSEKKDVVKCKDGDYYCNTLYDDSNFDEFKKIIHKFTRAFSEGSKTVKELDNITNYRDFIEITIKRRKAVTYSFTRKYIEQEVKEFPGLDYYSYFDKVYCGSKEKENFIDSDDFALVTINRTFDMTIVKTEMLNKDFFIDDHYTVDEETTGVVYFKYDDKYYCFAFRYGFD